MNFTQKQSCLQTKILIEMQRKEDNSNEELAENEQLMTQDFEQNEVPKSSEDFLEKEEYGQAMQKEDEQFFAEELKILMI